MFATPEHALRLVNAALAENNASDMFVTFLLATADLTRRRLTYVRAGHVPPFWQRAGVAATLRAIAIARNGRIRVIRRSIRIRMPCLRARSRTFVPGTREETRARNLRTGD